MKFAIPIRPSIGERISAEIDFRLLKGRLRLQHIGLRRRFVGLTLVDRCLRDVLVADKLLAALQLQRCVDLRRLRLGEIGALLVDRRLVGRLLDSEQQVAGLDVLPFGEKPLLDEPRHSRDNVDLVDRRHSADEIARLRHLTGIRRGHRDRRWRYCPLSDGGAAVSQEAQGANDDPPTEGAVAAKHPDSSRLRG